METATLQATLAIRVYISESLGKGDETSLAGNRMIVGQGGLRRLQVQAREQVLVGRELRVGGGQQLFAIENGVGPGHEAQGLGAVVHGFASRRQAHGAGRDRKSVV